MPSFFANCKGGESNKYLISMHILIASPLEMKGGEGDVTPSLSHNLASIGDIPSLRNLVIMDTTSIETSRARTANQLPTGSAIGEQVE